MASFAAVFVGGALLVIAGVVGRYGRRQHRRRSLVAGTPTTDVRAIDDEGRIELTGTVVADETFDSPIQDDESVLAAWEIEEWNESGTSDMWETRATGVYTRAFALDDGTGEVRIEIDDRVAGEDSGHTDIKLGPVDLDRTISSGVSVEDVWCSFEHFRAETTVPPDADPPERIAQFVQGEAGISPQTGSITNLVDVGTKHGERRYYEGTIEPGQEIYLLGTAEATSDATYPLGPDDVVITPPAADEDGSLIVSDRTEEELLSELGQYRWVYAVAAILCVVGITLLLVGGGVV